MIALVPLAELLAELAGSRAGATRLALGLSANGVAVLPHQHDDVAVAARRELVAAGVLTDAGVVSSSRAAELVIVCDVLAASTLPTQARPPDPRLVLMVPPRTVQLHDHERLDAFILDVIRQARRTLHLGGAFWNDDGFELLNSVLLPALQVRSVETTIYVNQPAAQYRGDLVTRLRHLTDAGPVSVRWFVGARPTMLHAKFVIRDRAQGYLGTANLTSWGMQNHIEAGVELTGGQSERFVSFLEQLEAASLFSTSPPTE